MIKYLERLLNINSHEVPRVFYAWIIKFCYKLGLTIGFTTIVAFYITNFSIVKLPFFYLIQAVAVIAGTFTFGLLLHFIDVKVQLYLSLFISSLLIFLSFFCKDNVYLYTALLLTVIGFFMSQANIFISNYIEDLFTPWENHRLSPLIESSDTFGGICGALIVSISVSQSFSDKVIFIWVISIIALLATVHLLRPFHGIEIPAEEVGNHINLERLPKRKVLNYIKKVKTVPFLQSLLVIVLLQWIIGHLVEFQYTKIIDESVLNGIQGESHQVELMGGLSHLQIIFYSFALFFQLILTSRILKFVGTFGGFVVHAIMTFFSSIGILVNFGYFTAILLKNNFEVSGIIHRNAYEASYYAFKHGSQRSLREFYEGFINPVGLIIGTLILILVQSLFFGTHFLIVINLLLVFFSALMVVFSFQMQDHYTNYAFERLNKMDNLESQEHAVEILAQKGHKNGIDILVKSLDNPKFDKKIRLKIIEELGKCGHTSVIADILPFIHSSDREFQLSALNSLATFEGTSRHLIKSSFGKFQVIEELKKLLESNVSDNLKRSVIKAMEHVNRNEIESLLLDILNSSSAKLQLTCLDLLETSNNSELAGYLIKFLKSKNHAVKARTAFLLLKFREFRSQAQKSINDLLASKDKDIWIVMLNNLHRTEDKKIITWAKDKLGHNDLGVKRASVFAMASIGDQKSIEQLAEALMSRQSDYSSTLADKAEAMDVNLRQKLGSALVRAAFFNKTGKFISINNNFRYLAYLNRKDLSKISHLFGKLQLNSQKTCVDAILKERIKFKIKRI